MMLFKIKKQINREIAQTLFYDNIIKKETRLTGAIATVLRLPIGLGH